MTPVSKIRSGLSEIPGALVSYPPDEDYRGFEQGVVVETLSEGQGVQAKELTCAPISPDEDGPEEDQEIPEFDPVIEIGPEIEEAIQAYGGEAGERIRRSVELHGVEALGWYVSFHYTGVQWGAYISLSGIAYLMCKVFSALPATWETKAHLAFHAILNHELFHFATDYAVAQAELMLEEPWMVPAKRAFRAGHPPYCQQEEKLANGYMLRAFRTMKPALRVRGKQGALREFVRAQPPGYRDGDLVSREGWDANLGGLIDEYLRHTVKGAGNIHLDGRTGSWNWPQVFPIRPKIDWRHCPIHLVHDGARFGIPGGWINFFSRLGEIRETEKFEKMLSRLDPATQDSWHRTKERLQIMITGGADLKKWPKGGPNVWSVRVNQACRAHLLYEAPQGSWTALSIGGHKEMGHG